MPPPQLPPYKAPAEAMAMAEMTVRTQRKGLGAATWPRLLQPPSMLCPPCVVCLKHGC
jgi:hypothetical protein